MAPLNEHSAAASDLMEGEVTVFQSTYTRPTELEVQTAGTHTSRNARAFVELASRVCADMKFGPVADLGLYTIGQLSKHLKVSLRTLRFYEQAGLLTPVRDGTRRLYDRADLVRLRLIVTLREYEASLVTIRALLARLADMDDLESMANAVEGLLVAIETANHDRIVELTHGNRRIRETLGHLTRTNS
ncbi:MAG: MerR family transcriptional regulator [Siculibacillus sp.]|nr:MerR family transcriptional regulator [Siculibacillus sp.]